MNVLSVKVGGKEITCQMGILSFRHYCDHHRIGLEQLGTHLQQHGVFAVTDLIFFSHLAYCGLNGKEVKVNRNECTQLIEEADEALFERVQEAILDIKMLGKSLRETQPGQAKKKQAKR